MNKLKIQTITLSEVLITPAIIGVVAALTLPIFVSKYNKFITETRLKKFYSEINQAITMAEADYGVKELWEMQGIIFGQHF